MCVKDVFIARVFRKKWESKVQTKTAANIQIRMNELRASSAYKGCMDI
jgi:hypothetical protein